MTLEPDEDGELFAYVFKTRADPFAGRINLFRVYQGVMTHDTQVLNTRTHAQGAHRPAARVRAARRSSTPTSSAPATSAPSPSSRRRAPATGSPSATSRSTCPRSSCPAPVMAFAIEPKTKGDEDKVFTALRRLQEEDPTIDLHRDPQTGEQIVAGLSQIHVEVIVDRMRDRFGAEVELEAAARALPGDDPRPAKAHGRHKKQTRRPRPVRRLPHRDRAAAPGGDFEFVNEIKGGVIPDELHPRGREGRARGDGSTGTVAGLPGQGRARAALRRLVPLGRLVGDGVQARRLDGHEAGAGAGRPGAARADHARHRVACPRSASAT